MQMAVDNIWLIRAPGCLSCLVPQGSGGAHRALPAPGDGWLTLVRLSQRCSRVHSPPASQSFNLSLTQNDLIIVTRLSLRTCSAVSGGKACSTFSLANWSTCHLCLPVIKIWLLHGSVSHRTYSTTISPLPVFAGWPWTSYSTSLSTSFLCSKKGLITPTCYLNGLS